jgi:hypothetical protein
VTKPRPSYKTFVIERHVPAPRARVWAALLDLLARSGYEHEGDPAPHGVGARIRFALDGVEYAEETLSFEPPWRRVYQMVDGAPVALYQGTTALRDDGDTCELVWSYLVDPGPGPSELIDAYLARVQLALHHAVDRVASAAVV